VGGGWWVQVRAGTARTPRSQRYRMVGKVSANVAPHARLGVLLGGLAFNLSDSPDCPAKI
jgi:hypothetical protein